MYSFDVAVYEIACCSTLSTFWFYSGGKFCCSVIVAPVKNEEGNVLMYIVNHEELTPEDPQATFNGE